MTNPVYSNTARITDVASVIPVKDVQRSLTFYEEVLGFEDPLIAHDAGFGSIKAGQTSVHFMKTQHQGMLYATSSYMSLYVWVQDIQALFAEMEPRLMELPTAQWWGLHETGYGLREFHVKDPDGCAILFGEQLRH